MRLEINNFLLSVASALMAAANDAAGSAAITLGRDLFIIQANERSAADPHAVFRSYASSASDPMRPFPLMNIQLHAIGRPHQQKPLELASRLYEALFDAKGLPRTLWTIDGKKFNDVGDVVNDTSMNYHVIMLTPGSQPTVIRQDDQRCEVTFNFTAKYQVKNSNPA